MRFNVQFKIGNRLSSKSRYSIREVCLCLVDTYSLTDREIDKIVHLRKGDHFRNEDMVIERVS